MRGTGLPWSHSFPSFSLDGAVLLPTVLHLVSLVVGRCPPLLLLCSQLWSSQHQKMPGVVWSSTDFLGHSPSLPWSLSTGFTQSLLENHVFLRRFLLAPHPSHLLDHLSSHGCVFPSSAASTLALFSASYCLARHLFFQLTTPAPHLQQSFNSSGT